MTAIDGALLNDVESFHRRFNVFPTEAVYVAVTLWDARRASRGRWRSWRP